MPITKMKDQPFNLNDHVRVRVTEHGKKMHRQIHEQLNQLLPAGLKRDFTPLVEDSEGYSRWQLWELMHHFAPHMYIGGKPPIETSIILEVEE